MTLKRSFRAALLLALMGFCTACYALLIEPRMLKVRHVSTGAGPKSVRIVHISDLHIAGVHVSPARVKSIVARVNEQRPDIIIITGDFANGHMAKSQWSAGQLDTFYSGMAALSGLSAPQGVFATLGNHDSWFGKADMAAALRGADVRVLDNQAALLDGDLCLVGLADRLLDDEDPAAFNGCPPTAAVVGAMHSPDSFEFLPADTRLAMAGHTHGGQVNLPFYGRRVTATALGEPYAYGLKDWSGTPVYISSGIGTSILPIRFRSAPEIAVITLRYSLPQPPEL